MKITKLFNQIKFFFIYSSFFSYFRVRFKYYTRKNKFKIVNRRGNFPFKSINIKSYYFDPLNDLNWSPLKEYLQNNTKKISLKFDDPYLDIPINGSFEVGGFSESIFFSILVNVGYDIGKKYIKEILNILKKSSKEASKKCKTFSEFDEYFRPSESTIKFIFSDQKEIDIIIPFPTYFTYDIETLELNQFEKELSKSKKISIKFDVEDKSYRKGSLFDQYK